ncbi:unnamed protein product, partial [marine sediment metagenome]
MEAAIKIKYAIALYNFRVGLNYFYMGRAATISWIIAIFV